MSTSRPRSLARRAGTTDYGLSARSLRDTPARGHGSQVYALSHRVLDVMHTELQKLLESTSARCALVVDRTGCIMASAGDFHPIQPATMGATAAATIAALNAMVSKASSPEVSVKFYGGDIERIHFVLLESRLAVCLLCGAGTSDNGLGDSANDFARMIALEIDKETHEKQKDQGSLLESVSYIENKLDDLFKDMPPRR